jgi:hypothetical protein
MDYLHKECFALTRITRQQEHDKRERKMAHDFGEMIHAPVSRFSKKEKGADVFLNPSFYPFLTVLKTTSSPTRSTTQKNVTRI